METVIIVDIFGDWSKHKVEKTDLNEGSFIGETKNGIRKYSWNFKMFFALRRIAFKNIFKRDKKS